MRIGALIPIRLASERLPGKALAEIAGRSAVTHLLDRACASTYVEPSDVVVCTTEDASDDPLAEAVADYGCEVYRGARDDLIERLWAASHAYRFDAVIQIDGDDLLCDPGHMDLTMKMLLEEDWDVVLCEGLPLGVAAKSLRTRAIDRVHDHYLTRENDTGFSYLFTKSGLCSVRVVHPLSERSVLDEARLTLDYEEDLHVFRAIFEALYEPGRVFGVEAVVSYLRANPGVLALNRHLQERYWARTNELAKMSFRDDAGNVIEISS